MMILRLWMGLFILALLPAPSMPFASLPNRHQSFGSSQLLYAEAPERARLLSNVLRYRGAVDQGYGRGGKKLGVPTANLPSSLFQNALEDVPTGVYFGWATLEGSSYLQDPYKAVVNVGYSPTFEGAENKEKIIEAHLIVEELSDFYGVPMRLQLVGFLRDEQKFDSFPELIAQIHADVADAKSALECPPYATCSNDDSFLKSPEWIGSGGGDAVASWEVAPMDDFLESLQ